MPYPPGHRDANKATIVRAARRLFNRYGFDGVSVGQIMAEAGLTHGGFYRHFDSKSDLYAEALQCFFTDPGWDNAWEGIEIDRAAIDAAYALYNQHGLGARDDAIAMQFLIPGWTFDDKRPCLVR